MTDTFVAEKVVAHGMGAASKIQGAIGGIKVTRGLQGSFPILESSRRGAVRQAVTAG
jgi:hypothetical protein